MQTLTLSCGQDAWFLVRDDAENPFQINLCLLSGDANVDGHNLLQTAGNCFDGGSKSYIVSSWSGAIVEYDASQVIVMREPQTSGLYTMLLNVFSFKRILVVDTNMTTATAAANFCYSQQTRSNFTVTLINMNAAGENHGVIYIYPGMEYGTIHPHHTADFIPEIKHGVWIGTSFEDLVKLNEKYLASMESTNFIAYLNSDKYNPTQIQEIVEKGQFDILFTTNDYVASMVRPSFKLPPVLCGVPKTVHTPVEDISSVVQRHVFSHQVFKPHHLRVTPHSKVPERVALLPPSLRSTNIKTPFIPSSEPVKSSTAYAAVVSDGELMNFRGFVYCDNNCYLHSLVPLDKPNIKLIELDACVIV